MTIKDLAQEKGISTQAVYKRIKRAGLDINSLVSGENRELTAEGEVIVNKLFDTAVKQIQPDQVDKIEALNRIISDQENHIDRLKLQLSMKDETIADLRQQLERAEQRVLLAMSKIPDPPAPRRTFLQLLEAHFGRSKKE